MIRTMVVTILVLLSSADFLSGQATRPAQPNVILLRPKLLAAARQRLKAGDAKLKPAFEQLIREADAALDAGPFSVMDKQAVPPSGDKHDYMSLGTYWWPDPSQPDGKPYIRRDGERNPELEKLDRQPMRQMADAVETLALAYYFSGKPVYADRAARLLRVWFLDDATRMNPNLQFGQAIPGRTQGRGIGIIDTTSFLPVVDAVGMIEPSKAWTTDDDQRMRAWFHDYLSWLLNSPHGRSERATHNNHGTYYDVQVATFALFVGDRQAAREAVAKQTFKRVAEQIEPDGRQPLELARTKSFGYSVANLRGMFHAARLAENFDADLWHYKTDDGRGLRAAIDWLAPHAHASKKWPYQQLGGVDRTRLFELLRRAAIAYQEPRFEKLAQSLDRQATATSRVNLLYPYMR